MKNQELKDGDRYTTIIGKFLIFFFLVFLFILVSDSIWEGFFWRKDFAMLCVVIAFFFIDLVVSASLGEMKSGHLVFVWRKRPILFAIRYFVSIVLLVFLILALLGKYY